MDYLFQPFTYLIGWSKHDTWYYGVRYADGCNPSDLWTKYFTSSKNVLNFREKHGEPDVVLIRKTFERKEAALQWEYRVISRFGMLEDKRFLNQRNGGGGKIVRKKGSVPWNKGKTGLQENVWKGKSDRYGEAHRANLAYKSSKEYKSLEVRERHAATVSGAGNPCYSRRWMNKNGEHKRVKIEDIAMYLEMGWFEGRVNNRDPHTGKFSKG